MLLLFYRALFGAVVCIIFGFFAYLTKQLTLSGTIALFFVGILLTTFGSWISWCLMLLFFLSSGLIHLIKKRFFTAHQDLIAEKGHTRDAQQVLANSLPAVLSLLLYAYTSNELFLVGYVAGIAGATSDTWASEIGQLSPSTPRSILTFKQLPTGTSGGITGLGTLASVGASFLISISFWLLFSLSQMNGLISASYFLIPFFSGILASVFDSLLGASLQARYECVVCHQWTEQTVHHGQQTHLIKGLRWLDNDKVNFFSGLLTIVVAGMLWRMLQ
ncbi:hypothetical protein IGI37_003353 [Enterococcus sp. AZ194]|uniref:DUF92 domain-containing protein n=1 Tax=Enterococcus sp. AZ194 TaxID=2774629 RepID=UPI003F2539C4